MYAALLADPDYHKLDWFDAALHRLEGITKAAKLIRVSASRLQHYRERGWSSLTSDQMMNIAQASGVPMLGLIVQCNQAEAKARGGLNHSALRQRASPKGSALSFDGCLARIG